MVLLATAGGDGEPGALREDTRVRCGRAEGLQALAGGVGGDRVEPVAGVIRPVQIIPGVIAAGYPASAFIVHGGDEIRGIRAERVVAVCAVLTRAARHLSGLAVVEAFDRGVIDSDRPAVAGLAGASRRGCGGAVGGGRRFGRVVEIRAADLAAGRQAQQDGEAERADDAR